MGKNWSEKDEIKFENGKFTSVDCTKNGCGSGSYETTVEGDKTHSIADTYSEKSCRITWVGTIFGDNISRVENFVYVNMPC